MATTSEVEVALAAIAQRIYNQRQVMVKIKANATAASTDLAAIPTDYAAVISTIQAYGTTDAYEAAVKAKFAKMVTEYNALKADADGVAAVNLND